MRRQVRDELLEDFPSEVPYLSVFSMSDGVVDDCSARFHPAAEKLEVDATHMGGWVPTPRSFDMVVHPLALATAATAAPPGAECSQEAECSPLPRYKRGSR